MAGEIVWLASFPKSGNTWFRLLLANLKSGRSEALDINSTFGLGPNLLSRPMFDNTTMLASGLLTPDEVDQLRPSVTDILAAEAGSRVYQKVHDAYTKSVDGVPLFGGATARAAIYIVRDPRDVVPSFAHFNRLPIDEAIGVVNSPASYLCGHTHRQGSQLRQKLLGWSGHVQSWLQQTDIPVHLIRYEDLKRDTVGTFGAALRFLGEHATESEIRRAVQHADIRELQRQEQQSGFRERLIPSVTFFRRGEAGSWRNELLPEQAHSIVRANATTMRQLGYPVPEEAAISAA